MACSRSLKIRRGWAGAAILCGLWCPCHAEEAATLLHLRESGRGYQTISTAGYAATVVVFVSMDCPMSMDYSQRAAALQEEYSGSRVRVLLVSSNGNETDADVNNGRRALRIAMPIYRDPGGAVASALHATATPTAVVIDSTGAIRYRGAIDDSRDPARVKTRFAKAAVDAVLEGKAVAVAHTRVMGCSIQR